MKVAKSKSKPGVEFQYGGRFVSEIGNSNTSALDWDIWLKFGMLIAFDIPKGQTWPNRKYIVRCCGRHLVKSIWRHTSVGDHLICIKFGRPVQNHMPMIASKSKSKPELEFQLWRPFVFRSRKSKYLGRGLWYLVKIWYADNSVPSHVKRGHFRNRKICWACSKAFY